MQIEDRYARHRIIEGWNQERLQAARVMVAGAGAIGNEVIQLLALIGVGHLLIVDFDDVDLTNLTRSPLFRESDVGRPKAVAAAERALQINDKMDVRAIQGDLEYDVGLGVYRSVDLVIGCLDSLNARLALNRACRKSRTPWLNGAIELVVAEVSLFGSDDGACFECGMSDSMWERRGTRYSCTGLRAAAPEMPVPTTAVVASLAATYLVQETLYLLHSGGSTKKEGLCFSEKITLSLRPYETAVYALPYNKDCLAHDPFGPVNYLPELPSELTAGDLLRRSGLADGVLELGFDLVTEMRCVACGGCEAVIRPLERCTDALDLCPACGADGRCPETLNWLDAASPLSRVPLAELKVPEHAVLCVKDSDTRLPFQLGGSPIWNSAVVASQR